ncbi:MAG: YigZ family protein [Acutalibacteraceae bacterium]|nr:YigZ family protein [Acutalibacteraceae bacterium]
MQGYLTVSGLAVGEYEEKRSKFIATLKPVKTEEEAVAFVKEMKSKYWDARHNVFAYRLKNGDARFSDDGEPHSTAGKPVLDILTGKNLTDICIVVTRYFGGILLGTGGLVRAYSEAAKAAVSNSEIVEMGLVGLFSVVCDYQQYNTLIPFIDNFGGVVSATDFAADITVKFSLENQKFDDFSAALTDKFFGKLTVLQEGKIFSVIKILK